MRVRIAGGQVVDPANGINAIQDVFIANGKIVGCGVPPYPFEADQHINARGLVVCPGLVDICARLREPGLEQKATIASESRAAAKSGITTLCIPPDTDPVVDTPAVVELIHQRAEDSGLARIEIVGALTQGLAGERLAEMGALNVAGCVGVGNARKPIRSTEVMRRAMEYAATFGLTVFIEPEDPWLAENRPVHDGAMATRLGLAGIPEVAETIALSRELLLVEQTGVRAHFMHLSTARSVEMISQAKDRGLAISASVTAHHLHLSDSSIDGFNSECHVQPPLRSNADREGLCKGVSEGVIDIVCSDHQPHERDARLNPFSATEPGISALETLLPLALRLVDEDVLDLNTCIARLTNNPARLLGVERGTLTVGGIADVCVFDPNEEWTLSVPEFLSEGHNSPFLEQSFRGRVKTTLVGGLVTYER